MAHFMTVVQMTCLSIKKACLRKFGRISLLVSMKFMMLQNIYSYYGLVTNRKLLSGLFISGKKMMGWVDWRKMTGDGYMSADICHSLLVIRDDLYGMGEN